MTARLLVVTPPRVASAGDPIFGDPGPLAAAAVVPPLPGRAPSWVVGPEVACRQTAERLELPGGIEPALRGPDAGDWDGRRLAEVSERDPERLRRWVTDPATAPPGGESLEDALRRIGRFCDDRDWPRGRSVLVVGPVTARLLALHALDAPVALMPRLDVGPGGRFELSGRGGSWRLLVG